METKWSAQQEAIFSWFERTEGDYPNLVVVARAGTGKTTTIIEGVNRAPERSIVMCAFNKRIADELTILITNPRAQAKTLHSIGYACVRRFVQNTKIEDKRKLQTGEPTRADKLAIASCEPGTPDPIVRLVSRLHTLGREMVPHALLPDELMDIAVNFECEPDEQFQRGNFNTEYVVKRALIAMRKAAEVVDGDTIDFADMIFLPVRNGWLIKMYDLVVVDEAQDMTMAQLEIAEGICNGRICVVGDDRQAIYAFRGADSNSLGRLKAKLGAAQLMLTTTYRCGHNIVAKAQELVPDIEAHESNHEGEVIDLMAHKLVGEIALGDFLVSRFNAPLVHVAMQLLKSGKRTRIAGRDIGYGLTKLVRKLAKGRASSSIPVFMERVSEWKERETLRLKAAKKDAKAAEVADQADMLTEMSEGATEVQQVVDRIEALFTDDGLGQAGVITCSSVHRVKGLEAKRVFVLWDTMRSHSDEELNIQYVALTRAKESLILVRG